MATMQLARSMEDVGKQYNPESPPKSNVNHEGLKRVYKTRAQREAEAAKDLKSLKKSDQPFLSNAEA